MSNYIILYDITLLSNNPRRLAGGSAEACTADLRTEVQDVRGFYPSRFLSRRSGSPPKKLDFQKQIYTLDA